ncbi:MAG: NUDIX domain-containing protein [Thiohalomonadaceae bacterium]
MAEPSPDVEILEKTVCYEGFFKLEKYRLRHRRFAGDMSPVLTRELFERGHAVAVMLYDPVRDRIVLLEQFRIGALQFAGGPWLLEIVAGIVEPGERAEEVALRECREETGVEPTVLEPICTYLVSPGGTSESISLFCGRVDSTGVGGLHGLADESEDIRVCTVSFDEAWDLFRQGRINSAAPVIALQWLAMNRTALRERWA